MKTGWILVAGLWEYTYNNAIINADNVVDIIPENASVSIIQTAQILPKTVSSNGSVKLYSTNLPSADILVTMNIL
jgi:hypothetical protein